MIELKTLESNARKQLLQNTEFYTNLIWKKTPFLRPLHSSLTEEFGSEYEQEMWLLLTFSAKCVRYGTKGFRLSLDKSHYTAANKQYSNGGHKITATKMTALIMVMEEKGYVSFLKGFWTTNDSEVSCVILKDLQRMLDKTKCDKLAMARDINDVAWVEVTDEEKTTTTKRKVNGVTVKSKKVVLKNTQNIRGIKEHKEFVQNWYGQIRSSVITINGEVDNCIIVKQRFEGDLTKCGRYFLGGFQTQKSELRATIEIDGEATVEVDYTNCQPRMLAASVGVDLPADFDAYDIEGLPRSFVKGCLFSTLFTCSRKDAKTSITNKLKEANITDHTSEEVLSKFEAHNHYIKEFFYDKTLYQKLQNLDSRMMRFIVEHFMAKGETVLGYHDSAIVKASLKDELVCVMKAAWESVLGTSASCVLKVEMGVNASVEAPVTGFTRKATQSYQVTTKPSVKASEEVNTALEYYSECGDVLCKDGYCSNVDCLPF